jgi:CubicO group peptidase (beta-lactamase class C family)
MGHSPIGRDRILELCDGVALDTGFSGTVRVDLADGTTVERAYGLADRMWDVAFTTDTRSSIASGTKGFTALAVMALIEAGSLSLDTTARSLLRDDLALVDDTVTVEQLLGHRSGIGDYLDESVLGDITDYTMSVPVHQLDSTPSFLAVLDGHEQVSPPGERFAYNNAGFVVLALLAERAAGQPFERLVDELVARPAGLTDTAFIRSDSLPPGVATGYLDDVGMRTNALHLPLVGSGDGGLFSTTADIRRFWLALFDGRIVSTGSVELMTTPGSDAGDLRYGLGFWLAGRGPMVKLEGYDAGVSFRSWHDPVTGQTYTVIGNTSDGAWLVLRALASELGPY